MECTAVNEGKSFITISMPDRIAVEINATTKATLR